MGNRVKNHFGCWLLAIGFWYFSFLFVPERSQGMDDRVKVGGRLKSGGGSGFGTLDFRHWTLDF
jgi:hypothetical protein